jgi:hypothetical protein
MYDSDTIKVAFEVEIKDYLGDNTWRPQQISRNKSGTMIIVDSGFTKHRWAGTIFLDSAVSGTVVYDGVTYSKGTPAHAVAMPGKIDLKLKSFEDDTFWNGWVVTQDIARRVTYDPTGKLRTITLQIEEK